MNEAHSQANTGTEQEKPRARGSCQAGRGPDIWQELTVCSNTHRAQLPGTGETSRPPAATSPGTGHSQSDSKKTEEP